MAPTDPRPLAAAILALLLAPAATAAFSGGPPDGSTGGPGEGSCVDCHVTFPPNSGAGGLSLAGLPAEYEPGASYPLTVQVDDPAASRWGFQLTPLDADGQAAGDLAATAPGTQRSQSGDRIYLKQGWDGTQEGQTGAAAWEFVWTAPAEPAGPVTLWTAGLAADGNSSPDGDHVYHDGFTVAAPPAVDAPPPAGVLQAVSAAPNPFNPRTTLRLSLATGAPVTVTVLTVDGRRVTTLQDGRLPAGAHALAWDGRSEQGRPVGAGVYLAVVQADGDRRLVRLTLVK